MKIGRHLASILLLAFAWPVLAAEGSAAQTAGLLLQGTVFSPGGSPASGVLLKFFEDGVESGEFISDTNGRFTVTFENGIMLDVFPGNLVYIPSQLFARDVEHNLGWSGAAVRYTTNLNFRLGPGLEVTGVVRDPQSNGVVSASVGIAVTIGIETHELSRSAVKTDKEGKYTISGLPPDWDYRVFAVADNYKGAGCDITQAAAGVMTLPPLVVRAINRQVAGIVLGVDGKPLADARVMLNADALQPSLDTFSDDLGHFTLKTCDGDVTIRAEMALDPKQEHVNFAPFPDGTTHTKAGDTNVIIKIGTDDYKKELMKQSGQGPS